MVETGKGAHGVVIDPASRYAYISNIYGDDVAVLDIAARQVVDTVPSGDGPNGISFSPMSPAAASATEITIRMPAHEDDGMPSMGH